MCQRDKKKTPELFSVTHWLVGVHMKGSIVPRWLSDMFVGNSRKAEENPAQLLYLAMAMY